MACRAMPEARCGLLHIPTRRMVAKEGHGDCPAQMSATEFDGHNRDAFNHSNLCNKLQVVERDASGTPSVIWIRNDHHPERCLWNKGGEIRWVDIWSSGYTESKWEVCLTEATATTPDGNNLGLPRLFSLKSMHDNLFLGTDGRSLYTSREPELWGWVRAGDAWSPGNVAMLALGVPLAVAGTAVAPVSAVGAATAAAIAAAAATEVSTAVAVGAVFTAVGAVGGALAVAAGCASGDNNDLYVG